MNADVEIHLGEDYRQYAELNANRLGLSLSAFIRFVIRGGGPVVTWDQFKRMPIEQVRDEIQDFGARSRSTAAAVAVVRELPGQNPGTTRKRL